jgi:hypothetical protein
MAEFTTTINGLSGGRVETELSMKLKELIEAVRDTGKKGSITLKLTVEQNKKNEKLIEISDEVTAKIPQPRRNASSFVLHEDQLILLEDTQLKLNLRQIEGPVVEVEPATAPAGFQEVTA